MPPPSFALTKIRPPRLRAGLVARDSLEERMTEAVLSARLTLVAAAAGFGKTAALTRLIARLGSGVAVAWIAFDPDDDPAALFACLCGALEPFDPPWRTDPDSLIAMAGGGRSDRRAAVSELLNALAACEVERGLVVFDDAHRVRDPVVFELLDQMLERLPQRWGMVVSTRTAPPLALARLRAGGEFVEFREGDLRFELDAVRALLSGLPPPLHTLATGERLLERTQGWAVGLRLALNRLARGQAEPSAIGDPAGDRHVFDYLLAEVLDALPVALRDFLLRCSVLAELTASRCAAVSGDAEAAVWLDEIERRGLFVSSLEGAEPTLRLHDLFRDFLQDRLRRERPAELPALNRRAAAGEPDVPRRIGYLLRAGDWTAAEAVVAEAGGDIVTTVGAAPLLRLLEQFPAELQERSGVLAQAHCWCAWARWNWPDMTQWAHRARIAFTRDGNRAAAGRAAIYEAISQGGFGDSEEALARIAALPLDSLDLADRALAAMVRIQISFDGGALREVGSRFAEVLDLIEQSDSIVLWFQCVPRTLQLGLPGMRAAFARFVAGALRIVPDQPTALRALAYAMRAWGEMASGDLAAATGTLHLAEADARWLGPPPNVRVFVGCVASMLHALRGEREEAYRGVGQMLAIFDDPDVGYQRGSLPHALYRLHHARIADVLGDVETLHRLGHDLPDDPPGPPSQRRLLAAQRAAVAGRLAWHAGDFGVAAAGFGEALADEVSLGAFGQAREIRLRLAASLLTLGRVDAAAQALLPALEAARREDEAGGALAAGRAVLGSLARAPWGQRLEASDLALLGKWLSACAPTPAAADEPDAPTAPRGASGAVSLTTRELEVLRHIAAGDSNKLIARALDLSPHTVKRHVANILDKLDLQSRGQAAAWHRRFAA